MTDHAEATKAREKTPFRERMRARDLTSWSIIAEKIADSGVSRARIMRMADLTEQAIGRGLRRGSKPRHATRVRIAEALKQVAMRRAKGWL